MQERMPVSFGWQLPDGRRFKAVYDTRVVAYEEYKDRWLVVLETLQTELDAGLPPDVQTLVAKLSGQWAYVPDEARNGITLPLKYETLTGRIRYFYRDDPRRS